MNKIKLTINLTEEQRDGYPVSTESLWFFKEGKYFRLINIPFFIDGLSMEDLVSLEEEDGNYKVIEVIERSANSTVWITINDEDKGGKVLKLLHAAGCGYEGGVLHNYFSINIPSNIDFDLIETILAEAEEKDILLSFDASFRH